MQYKTAIPPLVLCLLLHSMVSSQSVLYSSAVSNDVNTTFQVIGKAGNFYWLYKTRKNISYKNGGYSWPPKQGNSFEVYDERLQRVKEISSPLSDSVIKQYLIPQRSSFDQLMFKKSLNKTSVVVNRFTQDGTEAVTNAHLFDFPQDMSLEDLLVTRSPDRTKILLLGFVRSTNLAPDVYARVYTRNWELLHEKIYKEGYLLQPLIQYDRTGHVLEATDAGPVKITNSGDWSMVVPSRRQNNYVLCYFKKEDSSFVQADVNQFQNSGIEYCNLSLEENGNAYLGILEHLSPTDKRVRVMQYSFPERQFGHDTSYKFSLPDAFKKHEQYLFQEEFIPIPGKGFMYMREYGRRYYIDYFDEQIMLDNEEEYEAYNNHASKLKFNENEYTRNSDAEKKRFKRGDLSMKYFPFNAKDTCWSGLLHVEQVTELRYDDLSYACVSSRDKIFFLYNSLAKNEHKVSTSTVLDHNGQPVEEGFIFWRSDNVLNFQKARLIQQGELFVPFERKTSQGFAIIRF